MGDVGADELALCDVVVVLGVIVSAWMRETKRPCSRSYFIQARVGTCSGN